MAWAVRENAPALQAALDAWLAANPGRVEKTYRRFFVDRAGYREREESEYLTSETGSLSEYDTLLARAAVDIGWDWRLLASQAYQESKFDPAARSWAGAQGLLQLMPATAREVGVADAYDPEQNVAGAVRYLEWLEGQWAPEVADPDERLRFVLASYNAGRGHVLDAQRLAAKHGDDPMRWDDVAYWLLQKSKRKYYNDPVVRYGYCRGLEPVTYVALILERFEHYREFVEGEPLGGEAVAETEAT
ncbi:MAG: transglycosylase SLT domain-containing protein [Gemmatimonadetes bacterium]|nr:transglycosylase SLT domain-containing protein [Gemmatimonadota bacterium]